MTIKIFYFKKNRKNMIKIILLLFTMYITSLLNENTIVDLTKHFFFKYWNHMGFESFSLTRRTLNYFVYIEELLNIKPCLVKFKEENIEYLSYLLSWFYAQ